MNHHFVLTRHSSECFKDYIKKELVIDIFSPQKNGIISVNLEVRLLLEEKIEIKNIRLSHPSVSHHENVAFFFIGCFGLENQKNLEHSLKDLAKSLQSEDENTPYVSGSWAEFADQFKEWFNKCIKKNLISESKIATSYFQQKEKE